MSIFELIDFIAERPGMYLGRPSLSRFESFLLGWTFDSNKDEARNFLAGFQAWVAAKYEITSSHSWADIIDFHAADEASGLARAFQLLREYRALNSVRSTRDS